MHNPSAVYGGLSGARGLPGLVAGLREELQKPAALGSHRLVDGQQWRAVGLVRDPFGHWRQIWELATDA